MKKETGVAILLGIIAGISIAVFVIFSTRNQTIDDSDVMTGDITPTLSVSSDLIDPLVIKSPEDEDSTDADTITIDGTAQEDSLIVIQTAIEEFVVTSEDGTFSQDVDLVSGENIIKITAYNDKNIDTRTLSIFSTNIN